MGYPGELKYEAQGGPGLAACSQLVRRLGFGPRAIQGLLDWAAYNALIGNADANAKNLALICDQDGHRQPAPLYDMVPTFVIYKSLFDSRLTRGVAEAESNDGNKADQPSAFDGEAGYAPGSTHDSVGRIHKALQKKIQD